MAIDLTKVTVLADIVCEVEDLVSLKREYLVEFIWDWADLPGRPNHTFAIYREGEGFLK